jgi:hypothetical protein
MTTTLSESAVHREMVSPRVATQRGSFIDDLTAFATQHQAQHWRGTFAEFLRDILPLDPSKLTRSSHQYVHDMLCAYRDAPRRDDSTDEQAPRTVTALFAGELFGIDSALERVIDYFKAAAAGSDVGRRLLLLLGPPSGGKSSLVILLKRGLEEYSHCDECEPVLVRTDRPGLFGDIVSEHSLFVDFNLTFRPGEPVQTERTSGTRDELKAELRRRGVYVLEEDEPLAIAHREIKRAGERYGRGARGW